MRHTVIAISRPAYFHADPSCFSRADADGRSGLRACRAAARRLILSDSRHRNQLELRLIEGELRTDEALRVQAEARPVDMRA